MSRPRRAFPPIFALVLLSGFLARWVHPISAGWGLVVLLVQFVGSVLVARWVEVGAGVGSEDTP